MTTADQASKTAYSNRVEEVHQHVRKIIEGFGVHIAEVGVSPDWDHVGDLQDFCRMLKEASDFINGEE